MSARKKLRLYNFTFPREEICREKELYLRGGESRADGIYVAKGSRVSFDTYFNCFSHIKYKKYADMKDVGVRFALKGKGHISLWRYDEGGDILLGGRFAEGNGEFYIEIDSLPDKGFVYAVFEAEEDSILNDLEWHTSLSARRHVKIGIVICTYRREEFLKRNLKNLSEYKKSADAQFFDVFVIDNGKTVEDVFGDGIKVIPNENTGGSGGFTRGIREVCARGDEYTHFLLMDDDILFDGEILYRTASMLCLLTDDYKDASIGGGMLILDTPFIQEELGADWKGTTVRSRQKHKDARLQSTVCANEEQPEPDYNAWFYMCMPSDTPSKYGYPLPFFVRGDDIEYGLRAAENIIVTSGIAVWHEDFYAKFNPQVEYYIMRNELIVNARYPQGRGAFANWKKLVRAVTKHIVLQRYFVLDMLYKACDDYFKGADYFMSLDSAQNHLKLKEFCPRLLTEDELKEKYGIVPDRSKMRKELCKDVAFRHAITFNGYLIPKCFYDKDIAQMDIAKFSVDDFYLKKRVLQYDSATQRGFVSEIKKSVIIKAGAKLFKYLFVFLFKYRSTAKKYKKI